MMEKEKIEYCKLCQYFLDCKDKDNLEIKIKTMPQHEAPSDLSFWCTRYF